MDASSITVKGRKIDGEYSGEGHLVRVKHDNREKGAALGNSAVETLARDLLREMAEEGLSRRLIEAAIFSFKSHNGDLIFSHQRAVRPRRSPSF